MSVRAEPFRKVGFPNNEGFQREEMMNLQAERSPADQFG